MGDFVPYHLLILGQHQVISTQCDAENNGCDSFETVDPLLPLGPLATHIEHPAWKQKHATFTIVIYRSGSADDKLTVLPSAEKTLS